jgi:hypothetical protein
MDEQRVVIDNSRKKLMKLKMFKKVKRFKELKRFKRLKIRLRHHLHFFSAANEGYVGQ